MTVNTLGRLQSLRFWRGFSWQRATLMLALAGMEVSWLAPLVMTLHARSWSVSPIWYLFGLSAITLLLMAVANYLSVRQVNSPAFEGIVLATIILLGLFILRLYVFWGEPLLSLRWLRLAFFEADPRRVETLLVLATLGYLWFRAVTFLQRDISFFVIGYDFRKGVLGLILGVSLYTVLSHQSPILFVYTFFFFSLIAVALGRVEDKAQAVGGSGRPFGPGWVGLLAASSVLVLALGAVISSIWSLSGFRRFGQMIAPTGSVLGRVFETLALAFLRLLEPLIQWLIAFIRANLGDQVQSLQLQEPPPLGEILGQNGGQGTVAGSGLPPWIHIVLAYVLPALGVLLVLLALVLWLERRGKRWSRSASEERERTPGEERQGLGRLVSGGLSRLRNLANLIGQFGLGRRFYAAVSVRNIYANMLRLAAERGYPRHPAQTPNDFLPRLHERFRIRKWRSAISPRSITPWNTAKFPPVLMNSNVYARPGVMYKWPLANRCLPHPAPPPA